MSTRLFVIRQVTEERIEPVLKFHREHVGPYLWPRTFGELKKYLRAQCLWEALEVDQGFPHLLWAWLYKEPRRERLVGTCYIALDKEARPPFLPRSEFGGIFVADDCRNTGLATALGRVALVALWATDPPTHRRLIAHVHVDNPLPRRMLEQQLGFKPSGETESPPKDVTPPSMARNGDGLVVGDVFVFQRHFLVTLADWLESFDGWIKAKAGASRVDLSSIRIFSTDKPAMLEALRDFGATTGAPDLAGAASEEFAQAK